MRKYSEFKDYIDVDSVAQELALEQTEDTSTEDKWTGFCPFPENHSHGDTTGKFAIFTESKICHCYVCGSRSMLSFIMEILDLDEVDAEIWLRKHALEDARSDPEFVEDFLNAFAPKASRRPVFPEFGARVLDRFESVVTAYPEYMEDRHISAETAERFHMLYSPDYRVIGHKKYGFPEYVGPFVIFPHFFKGKLMGYQARAINENPPKGPKSFPSWVPKYKNTSEFPKDHTLYGYDQAKGFEGAVVATESGASVQFLADMGIPAVGTFGAEPTQGQLRLLSGFERLVIAQDGDKAGLQYVETLKGLDNVVGTIAPPTRTQGSDIANYGDLPGGRDRLRELYEQAQETALFDWPELGVN